MPSLANDFLPQRQRGKGFAVDCKPAYIDESNAPGYDATNGDEISWEDACGIANAYDFDDNITPNSSLLSIQLP